ncbi:hypothetical protein [Ruegeria sediminis]|uniref:hypothetical protein n=1 Tax=Ruegeria sediminis TaxID=2583820 RepID=UPI001485F07C|nr:hypothetical protein [Ruegeria sediminis]
MALVRAIPRTQEMLRDTPVAEMRKLQRSDDVANERRLWAYSVEKLVLDRGASG